MKRIFQEIITIKFTQFHEEIKGLNEPLAIATINIFNTMVVRFLPTPAKSHYTFNMRDVSKVFQGVYQANKNYYETRESVAKLWAHETLRVFSDRLNSDEDRTIFKGLVKEQVE